MTEPANPPAAGSGTRPGSARDSVDPSEVARFEAMASEWWDPDGRFRPLHLFNPERVRFIRDRCAAHFGGAGAAPRPLTGVRALDIGCGGGLIAEPLTRLGARVTGIDPSEQNIAVAHLHAERMGLEIDYQAKTAEELARAKARFDLVLALEVVEHVADLATFLDAAANLVAPGGAMVAATLNRSAKAFALAIIGAEYVMGWLPRGTHDWHRFVKPEELCAELSARGFAPSAPVGLTYGPLSGRWRLGTDTGVNYILFAARA
jgi:2-polyprenyl-6-hydroxyphenyl methylase/3-demethylubiquinone-9 3-methyltransferase